MRDDVRVIQRGGGARLAQEARADDLVGGQRGRQRLDGHQPLELEVPREEYDPHAPAPDLAEDFVLSVQRLRRARRPSTGIEVIYGVQVRSKGPRRRSR